MPSFVFHFYKKKLKSMKPLLNEIFKNLKFDLSLTFTISA